MESDASFDWVVAIAGVAVFGFYIVLLLGVLYVINFGLTLPMRRNERGRMFLGLLDIGVKEGRSPEAVVLAVASSGDRSLGKRFYDLTAFLHSGMKLSQALERVPRLLPPQVIAMLRAGERVGDIRKVLPACRLLLRDAVSHVRGGLNYLVVLAFVVTPFTLFVPLILRQKVIPSFRQVFEGMTPGNELPGLTRFVLGDSFILVSLQLLLLGFVWVAMVAYLGGPTLKRGMDRMVPGLVDAVLWRFPWRRQRLYRDFSSMLAVLLDSGVAEAEAVLLAGESTANRVMRRRAERVRALLSQGIRLPDAMREVDDSGEFRWRLANGLRRSQGFLQALTGWHQALDAKAFQLEQATAQATTTILVLLNGAVVGVIVAGMFLALITLLNEAVLW